MHKIFNSLSFNANIVRQKMMQKFGIHIFIIAVLGAVVFQSCENDLKVVQTFSDPEKVPDISMINFESLYSDSAKVKGKLTAPELDRYDSERKKYSEFPKGLHVYFYNDSLKVNAEIVAKYAINYDKTAIWEARNDVVVTNTKGERLNTEQLFWDQNRKIIYTKKYCRITTPDGMQHVGENGMEAKENFDDWKLLGASGTVQVKNATE
jgi:LPS export ABC transporter protein LptC